MRVTKRQHPCLHLTFSLRERDIKQEKKKIHSILENYKLMKKVNRECQEGGKFEEASLLSKGLTLEQRPGSREGKTQRTKNCKDLG